MSVFVHVEPSSGATSGYRAHPPRIIGLQVAKGLRHTMNCKQKPMKVGNNKTEDVDFFSGPTIIKAMMESEFHEDNGGFLKNEQDCTQVALGMMDQGVFFRAKFDVKKIKRKDGTIKEKKVLVHAGQQQYFNPKQKEPYVWRYNPLEKKTIFKGFMLIAAICFCAALPLWPVWLRNSVAGGLLFIVLGRPLIWLAVYLVTFSRWNFMIMPNMDEERKPITLYQRFFPLYELKHRDEVEEEERKARGETAEDGDESGEESGEEGGGDDDGDEAPDLVDIDEGEKKAQ